MSLVSSALRSEDLLTCVFSSRQTGHKKKLNSFISFPEQLDMGPFLEEKQGMSSVSVCHRE